MAEPGFHTLPEKNFAVWAKRFEMLSDPTRLRLLSYIHLNPSSPVQNLAKAAGVTQTAASQALRVLRENGWVKAERDGRLMRYELTDESVHEVLHFMGHNHTYPHHSENS